jgi:hypothetical protein
MKGMKMTTFFAVIKSTARYTRRESEEEKRKINARRDEREFHSCEHEDDNL